MIASTVVIQLVHLLRVHPSVSVSNSNRDVPRLPRSMSGLHITLLLLSLAAVRPRWAVIGWIAASHCWWRLYNNFQTWDCASNSRDAVRIIRPGIWLVAREIKCLVQPAHGSSVGWPADFRMAPFCGQDSVREEECGGVSSVRGAQDGEHIMHPEALQDAEGRARIEGRVVPADLSTRRSRSRY